MNRYLRVFIFFEVFSNISLLFEITIVQQKIPNCYTVNVYTYTLQPSSLQTHDSSETALANAIRKKTNAKSKPNSLIVSYFFPIRPQKKAFINLHKSYKLKNSTIVAYNKRRFGVRLVPMTSLALLVTLNALDHALIQGYGQKRLFMKWLSRNYRSGVYSLYMGNFFILPVFY